MAYYYSRHLVACLAVALATTTLLATPCAAQSSSSAADWVDLHNAARADVGVGPVSWNDTVAAYAESYAATRQDDCELKLSDGPYGENLYWGSAGAGTDWEAGNAVKLWVAQRKYYDHRSNTCEVGRRCSAYTQVVWRDSTAIGCARVVCSSRAGVFMICSYHPPGNLDGESPY